MQKHFDVSADELSREQLLAYLALKRKTYSSSSLNMQVCALKYYYRGVLRRQDLVFSIPNARRSKQIGEVLHTEEVCHLIMVFLANRAKNQNLVIARKALNAVAKSVVQVPRKERKAQLLEQLPGKSFHVCTHCGCINTITQLPIPALQVARAPPNQDKMLKE